eukprot:scaffold86849_cov17-Tisochrysis_lutea.AAC.2
MACAAGGCTARLWDAEHMQTSIRSYEMRECTLCVVLECALDACSELKHLCWVDGACTGTARTSALHQCFC